jgi:hypothetical protein
MRRLAMSTETAAAQMPEALLMRAILIQAYRDLTNYQRHVRDEAQRFFRGHDGALEQICAHLNVTQPIGDTLQGMRRAGVVKVEGEGNRRHYFAMDEQPS